MKKQQGKNVICLFCFLSRQLGEIKKNMTFLAKSFYTVRPDERDSFQYERSPFMSVSLPALNYTPSSRTVSLATPKVRQDTTIRDGKRK